MVFGLRAWTKLNFSIEHIAMTFSTCTAMMKHAVPLCLSLFDVFFHYLMWLVCADAVPWDLSTAVMKSSRMSMYESKGASLRSSDCSSWKGVALQWGLPSDGVCPPKSDIAKRIAILTSIHQKWIEIVFVWFALSSLLVLLTWYHNPHSDRIGQTSHSTTGGSPLLTP